MPIAGHPTIAAFIALEASGRINTSFKSKYLIKTKTGLQEVRLYKDKGETIVMMESSKPVFYSNLKDKYNITEILGLSVDDFIEDLPIQSVDTGLGHLIVPVTKVCLKMGLD